MASIKDATQPIDTTSLQPAQVRQESVIPPIPDPSTQRNPFLRSPMPVVDASPDSLRQFYGPVIPQFRVMPPPTAAQAGSKGDSGEQGTAGKDGKDGKNGISSRFIAKVITASLANNASGTGTVHLGRTFTVLQVTVNAACRVRLYQTAAALSADASRGSKTAPLPYAAHGLILDLVLSSATTWILNPVARGTDGSSFGTGAINYSVTNLSGSTQAIQVSFTLIAEEQ